MKTIQAIAVAISVIQISWAAHVDIPFTMSQGLMLIEASVDGQSGQYIFDTGSTDLIQHGEYDESLPTVTFQTLGSPLIAVRKLSTHISLGRLTHATDNSYIADLTILHDLLGEPIDGILGGEIFADRVVMIDYISYIITISDEQSSLTMPHTLPLVATQDVLLTSIAIEGVTYYFLLDSGASAHCIDVHLYDMHATALTISDEVSDIYTASDVAVSSMVDLQIGYLSTSEESFIAMDFSDLYVDGKAIRGIISLRALGADRILIDSQAGIIAY